MTNFDRAADRANALARELINDGLPVGDVIDALIAQGLALWGVAAKAEDEAKILAAGWAVLRGNTNG